MSDHQGETSFVSKFLTIVGGGIAVVAIGTGVAIEAPVLAGIGLAVGVGVGVNALMSGRGGTPPSTTPQTEEALTETVQPPDTSALQTRIETVIGVLRVLGELAGGAGNTERKELEAHLQGLRDGNAQPGDIASRAEAARDHVGKVLSTLPQQLAASVMTAKQESEWAPFKTGGALSDLAQSIVEAEELQTRLTDAAATLSAGQDELAADRYILKLPGVSIVKGKDDPDVAALMRDLRRDAKAALDATDPLPDALEKAKEVVAERHKTRNKKDPEIAASTLGKRVDRLLKLRDGMPRTAEDVVAGAKNLPGVKDEVMQARREARDAANAVASWKASQTNDLMSALAEGRKADNDAKGAIGALRQFEKEDLNVQAAGRRVYANMEAISVMLDAMDKARRGGNNKQTEQDITKAVREKARLTASSLKDAVDESVELYKTLAKDVDDAIDLVSATHATSTAKPPRFTGGGPTAPKYTYVLGTPAVAHWGTYDAEMQTLIREITSGAVALSDTFELSFTAYKNHSQGARRTKAYLDAGTMGGSTVMRGYFEWALNGTEVTVTPIAVTQEHGAHVRVLMGSL